ncbi:MAG: DUF4097 family beta strand repeat-containing protein [Candidatus Microbacterium colombiense]|nr:MAG: DUF4097 family beta strand repeat-containing protein [Microbacterium sp.]
MTTEQNDIPGGHTPLTPPPVAGPPASAPTGGPVPPQGTPPSGRSGGATAIMVVTAVVGGLALLGTGGTAAAAAAGNLLSSSRPDSVQTVAVDGIDSIDLDVDASSMRIEFGDVDEAELSVTNSRGSAWDFERDGDELIVRSPDGVFGWWFKSWFGDEEVAVLTLPDSLRGPALSADLSLDAGSLDVAGDFGDLAISVSAGALDVEGSARTLDVDMSAGRADVLLDGVDEADLGVSAGDLRVELTGSAPTRTGIDVSAGSLDLTVPDVEYRITQDVSAGTLNAKVEQASSARRAIDVELSAGTVTIRPAG